MYKISVLSLMTAIAFLSLPNAASAGVTNGGFELGSFSPGWTTIGDTSVQDSTFGITPPEGNYQAVLQTDQGNTGATASDIENFLGLNAGTLTSLGATEGSAIKQTISVQAGDVISFDWNFLTDEYPGSTDYNDFGFFSLGSTLETLANTETPNIPSFFSPFARETQYQSFAYTVTSSGTYTLGFGVMDVDLTGGGDTSVNSGLLVDNVQAVPEPMTILGSLAAIAFGVAGNKKRSKG